MKPLELRLRQRHQDTRSEAFAGSDVPAFIWTQILPYK
jgi:hypothetical protein